MKTEKRNFEKEAALWDEHPVRVKLATDLALVIIQEISLTTTMDVLDFGCGTGTLAIQLQPYVRSITGVDSSPGMLDVFNKKIAQGKLNTVHTSLVDLDKGDRFSGSYDLVVSTMTLHHIQDLVSLFKQLYAITAPAGLLCIADLDLEETQFHDDNTGVFHFGFDRTMLRKAFTEAGFHAVRERDAAEVVKPDSKGTVRRFPVFLMVGQKKI